MQLGNIQYVIQQMNNDMWINTYSNLILYFNNQFVSKGTIMHCITASLTLSQWCSSSQQSGDACAGGKQCFSIIFSQTPGSPAVVVVPIASDIIWSRLLQQFKLSPAQLSICCSLCHTANNIFQQSKLTRTQQTKQLKIKPPKYKNTTT